LDPRLRPLIALAAAALVAVAIAADDAARPVASLGGTIRDAKGKPIVGAAVSVEGGGSSKTDADGTWSVAGVAPGDVLVTAQSPGRFRVQTMLHVAAGETRSWDATIGMHGKITGHVVDEYGHPLTAPPGSTGTYGWEVIAIPSERWMQRPNSETWWVNTDATGAFAVRVSPDALFRLAVRNMDSCSVALVTEPMSAGLGDVTIRVLPSNMAHAHVHCRLEDSKGTTLTGDTASMQVFLFQRDRVFAGDVSIDASKGDWFSSRVAPGSYVVVASHPILGTFEFPAIDVRDAADVDLGVLRFPQAGRVRFTPARSGPGSDVVASVMIRRMLSGTPADKDFEWSWGKAWFWGIGPGVELRGDAAVEVDMPPGRYSTTVGVPKPPFGSIENVEIRFEVRSGETTIVTVPLRGAPARTIHVVYPGTPPSQAMLTVSDAVGIVEGRSWLRPGDWPDPTIRLVPGRHSIVVLTSDRRRLTATLDIPEEKPPDVFNVVPR
jgi:hypothetical protein